MPQLEQHTYHCAELITTLRAEQALLFLMQHHMCF